MPRNHTPAASVAAGHEPRETGAPLEHASSRQPATITETVATTLGGVVVGGAALWFLAPICFSC